MERVDRLERGSPLPTRADDAPAPSPAASRPSGRTGRSFAELKREQETSAPPATAPPAMEPPAPEAVADAAPVPEVDIDDVILAWPQVLDGLPPATKAAVREAQPLALDDGVITFGVPRAQFDVAVPRFRKEADNIRAALSQRLGREMKFKPVPHDFGSDPAASPSSSAAPLDEEPPDDEEIHLADLVDESSEAPVVDSVTLITQSLGATVVEEVPRD
jgi:hypothetical protein